MKIKQKHIGTLLFSKKSSLNSDIFCQTECRIRIRICQIKVGSLQIHIPQHFFLLCTVLLGMSKMFSVSYPEICIIL